MRISNESKILGQLIQDIERLYSEEYNKELKDWMELKMEIRNSKELLDSDILQKYYKKVLIMKEVNLQSYVDIEDLKQRVDKYKSWFGVGEKQSLEDLDDEMYHRKLITSINETYGKFVGMPYIGVLYPPKMVVELPNNNYMIETYKHVVFVGSMCYDYYMLTRILTMEQVVLSRYQVLVADMLEAFIKANPDFSEEALVYNQQLEKARLLAGYRRVRGIKHKQVAPDDDTNFINYVYKTMDNIRIFRGNEGYYVYSRLNQPVDMCQVVRFMDNNPINYVKKAGFKNIDVVQSVDPESLIQQLHSNTRICMSESTYGLIVSALSKVKYMSNEYHVLMNYLRLTHYYVTKEKSSGQAYVFSGAPGIGKSVDMVKIAGDTNNVYHHSYDHKTKQYYDGYYGQSIFTIDDMGHYSSDEWKILLKLVTPVPIKLPMAVADKKDLIPVLADEVYVTTNNIDKLLAMDTVSRDAICRRIELFEYASTDNGVCIEHRVYDREGGQFRTVQYLTQAQLYAYFESNIISKRIYPQYTNNQWVNYDGLTTMLRKSNVYLDLLLTALDKVFSVKVKQQYPAIMCAAMLMLAHSGGKISSYMLSSEYGVYSFKDRVKRFIGYRKVCSKLTPLEQEWATRVDESLQSEANVICVRPSNILEMEGICYKNDYTPLLDDIKKELIKRVSERVVYRNIDIPAHVYTAEDRDIANDFGHVLVDRPASVLRQSQYQIRVEPGNSIIDQLYHVGEWVASSFIPTNHSFTSFKDEREYRPMSTVTKIIDRDKFHKLSQRLLAVRSANPTVKRREQRRLAKLQSNTERVSFSENAI